MTKNKHTIKIDLKNIIYAGYIGNKEEELSYPQNLRFDLEIKIKITNDQINKLQQKNSENISLEEINLLDYSTISPIIKKIFCNSKFHLLESLGTTINDAIIKQNSNKGIIIQEIKTRIQKLIPPNKLKGNIFVEITTINELVQ